jgi:hypothetical protein
MNVPAELLQNVPAMVNFGKETLIKGLEGELGAFMFRQFRRVLEPYIPALAQVDEREMQLRVRRLEAMAFGFSDEMEQRKSHEDFVIAEELDEPTTADFVVGALQAAMETPSHEKQQLLGRCIARRLGSQTESDEELYLREALSIVRRCNAEHLYVLATVRLVRHTPLPNNITRDEAQTWLDEALLPLLERAVAHEPRTEVLDYLVSVGAVSYSEREWYDVAGGMSSHASAIEQHLIESTREHQLVVPGLAPQGLFYQQAVQLDQGSFSRELGMETVALAPYTLTAPGMTIAITMLDVIEDSIFSAQRRHPTNELNVSVERGRSVRL